jgi:hypothetical protein
MDSDFAFNFRNARKRLVPTCFQFTSHKTVGRVRGVVLPEGAIGCIARCFEIVPKRAAHLLPPLFSLCFGRHGRRNGARTDDRKKSILDGVIDPKSTESDAARLTIVHPPTGTAVARDMMHCA